MFRIYESIVLGVASFLLQRPILRAPEDGLHHCHLHMDLTFIIDGDGAPDEDDIEEAGRYLAEHAQSYLREHWSRSSPGSFGD